jgi:uncharacterized membrane protein YdjX (TVP38/TMEM64 family)
VITAIKPAAPEARSLHTARAAQTAALALAGGLATVVAAHLVRDCGMALDGACIEASIARIGIAGPLALVLFLAAAIVFSPIPSGPIAVAAGMLYGPVLGSVLVITGAMLGAVTAFCLGRAFRRGIGRPGAFRGLDWLARPRSQNRLMALVFASRLVPFISFDAVSYAAGISCLTPLRFALATLVGVMPVSILLTWSGGDMLARHGVLAATVLCGITLMPLAAIAVSGIRRR